MYKNYLISFVPYNEDTKEYYVYCAREDVKERAKELQPQVLPSPQAYA